VKPLFKDIKVKKQKQASLPKKAWEWLVGVAANVLESQKTEAVATRVPMKGSIDDPQADIWATIGGLLRNAFVRAFRPGFEGGIGDDGESSGAAEAMAKEEDKKKGGDRAEQKSTGKKEPEKKKKTAD
jgi:hypothetical protein